MNCISVRDHFQKRKYCIKKKASSDKVHVYNHLPQLLFLQFPLQDVTSNDFQGVWPGPVYCFCSIVAIFPACSSLLLNENRQTLRLKLNSKVTDNFVVSCEFRFIFRLKINFCVLLVDLGPKRQPHTHLLTRPQHWAKINKNPGGAQRKKQRK